MSASAPTYVDFFRADLGPAAVRRILMPAALLVALGAPMVCFGVVLRRVSITFMGTVSMMTGLLLGFIGLSRLLREDRYIGIRGDALVLHLTGGPPLVLAWEDIERITAEAGALVVVHRAGEELRYAGTFSKRKTQAVAVQLDEFRRKAAFHLL